MQPNRRRPAPGHPKGEDHLKDLKAIEVKLEDGRIVEFDIDAELRVPRDVDLLREAAINAHSKLAFWAYQESRALHAVRTQEQKLEEAEAHAHLLWRKYYDDHTAEFATNDMIKSRVALEKGVQSERIRLHTLRTHYNILRAVKDSLEHRCHLLRRLALESTTRA